MKRWMFLVVLTFVFRCPVSLAQDSSDKQLWLLMATLSRTYTMNRDTSGTYSGGNMRTDMEKNASIKITVSGQFTAVIENFAENRARDFSYHTDMGDPVSVTVTGHGSMTETTNSRETINGKLVFADLRSDNVSGSARPKADIEFNYSDDYKYFGVGIGIKAVGSYQGRRFDGQEWNDYGGDYNDYGLNCSGGGDPTTDKNCTLIKTATGYQGTWRKSENKLHHTYDGTEYETEEVTVQVSLVPYKESDKPEVKLIGCTELGAGQQTMIAATAKPEGGSFRFWAEPSSMMTVETDGSSANLTGASPEKGTLFVEYTTIEGKTAQTSQPASCVKVEKYNGGQAIPQIALYDINGKKLPGIKAVPVDAQPAEASELVKFEPADPGILSAAGVGNEVTLQGLRVGTTTLQAKTNCGETTGPSVEVEVVTCDDETIATLEQMKKAATENLVDATERLQKVAGSEEFEKARDELVSSTVELLAKAGLTIIANGATTGVVKVAAEIADKGSALSDMIASANLEELKNSIGKTASGESFEKIVETQFGEKVGELWGKSLSAAIGVAEVQQAAQKFADNIGEILKHEDAMTSLMDSYEKAMRNLENITKRQRFCKNEPEKPTPHEKPKPDQSAKPDEPTPPAEPKPKTTEPPVQERQTTEPTTEQPATGDEVLVDPEPPAQPPKQVGLPYEPSDCGCNQTKELATSSAGFSALGTGIKNLGNCVENFKSTSLSDYDLALHELSALTDSLSTTLKSDAGEFLVKAKDSKTRLDGIVNRVKSYDKAGNDFLNKMGKCPESVNSGMEVLKSAETITVDSIKTKY